MSHAIKGIRREKKRRGGIERKVGIKRQEQVARRLTNITHGIKWGITGLSWCSEREPVGQDSKAT